MLYVFCVTSQPLAAHLRASLRSWCDNRICGGGNSSRTHDDLQTSYEALAAHRLQSCDWQKTLRGALNGRPTPQKKGFGWTHRLRWLTLPLSLTCGPGQCPVRDGRVERRSPMAVIGEWRIARFATNALAMAVAVKLVDGL